MLGELGVPQVPRPLSSLSSRPASRSSHRHQARGRQSARHVPFVQDLVAQTLRCSKGDMRHLTHVESAMKALDSGRCNAPIWDIGTTDKRIKNLVDKHYVLLNDELAEALRTSYDSAKQHIKETSTRESQVTTKNLPDVLQLLFALSNAPGEGAHARAAAYLEQQQYPNGRPEEALTWRKILQEEPLEGQHWEGAYGLPVGATKEGWEIRNAYDSSESDLSDFGDFEIPIRSRGAQKPDAESPLPSHDEFSDGESKSENSDAKIMLEMKRLQYWRASAATPEPVAGPVFDLGDPRFLASAIASMDKTVLTNHEIEARPAVILEVDAVREALFMLQENASIFAELLENGSLNAATIKESIVDRLPKISHFSPGSFRSVLESLAQRATTMRQLRAFTRTVFGASCTFASSSRTQRPPPTPTLEAFAAAIDAQVRKFDTWCADYEEKLCIPHIGTDGELNICSLLNLEHRTSEFMGESFDLLLNLTHDILSLYLPVPEALKSEVCPSDFPPIHPSILCTFVLDALIAAARSEHLRGLSGSSQLIMEVFATTIEPLWSSLGAWIRRGMEFESAGTLATACSRKQSELFIQKDEDIPVHHIDFWRDGYKVFNKVRQDLSVEEQGPGGRPQGFEHHTIPMIFRAFANEILSAGKSVGLLRVLQSDEFLSLGANCFHYQPLQDWPPFRGIIRSSTGHISPDERDAVSGRSSPHAFLNGERTDTSFMAPTLIKTLPSELSGEDIAMIIRERLEPWCQLAHARLNRVIVEDCRLWHHVAAIEGLYFMRRGDTMAQFCQALFRRVQNRQPWNDYHTLNSLFRDVAASTLGEEPWLNQRLVRLTFHGIRARDPFQSIRAFDGLALEYQAPFPLNYLFDPSSIRSYSSIFTLLLQLRFAKLVLDRMVMRSTREVGDREPPAGDVRTFYAVRGRLIWFVSTVMHHVAINVIDLHVRRLRESLQNARSLDEMISFHANSLSSLLSTCTIGSSASSIRRGILSVLDLALRLNEVYTGAQDRAWANIATALTHPAVERRVGRNGQRRQRTNKVQSSRRRNIVGFASEVHIASYDDQEDDAQVAQEEADILHEATRDEYDESAPEYANTISEAVESSMVHPQSPSFLSSSPFAQRVEKLGSELDVLVRYVMKHTEGISEGGAFSTVGNGLEAEAFSMLNFAFEDWDL